MPTPSAIKDNAAPRLSQRKPLACRECTRRKVKCDKKIPCSRCHRLGTECTREVVLVRKQISKHGGEIGFLRKLKSQLEASGLDESSSVLSELEKRVVLLEQGDNPEGSAAGEIASEKHDSVVSSDTRTGEFAGLRSNREDMPEELNENDATTVKMLEYLAWGRHYGTCYPHRACSCNTHRSQSEMLSINSNVMASDHFQEPFLSDWSILPSTEDAIKIVNFHTRYLAWHHNSLHTETFTKQCENFWMTGLCNHPLWMALYLSVLSSSLWCVHNSTSFRTALGIDIRDDTCITLFRAMVDVLYAGNFLENLSLYSVQAIAISTEVAHNLGLSNLNATLSSAAVRIAQCLGLHRISDEPSTISDPSQRWHETVERETGKRVWCQLVIQDHFAIPFTDSYCINPSHYSTSLPKNCDDHDMTEKDDSFPTISSYARTLGRMATLIPPLLDNLGMQGLRNSLNEKYQQIINTDRKMRELVSGIPTFLLRQNPSEPDWIPWLGIARRSLAITAADKIIMIHRPFLFQSFQTSRYAYTRNTCVSAAITILRQHQQIIEADDVSIWTHSAFCITAAMVLGLEVLYPRADNHEKTNDYIELVTCAKDRLSLRSGDVLAYRGVRLIETILQEATRSKEAPCGGEEPVPPRVNFLRVVSRFLSSDDAQSFNITEFQQNSYDELDLNLSPTINNDFDIWLKQVFGYDSM